MAATADRFDRLEILMHFAGVGLEKAALKTTLDDWQRVLTINLTGTFFSIRAFHDLLLKSNQRAKVICFSGGGATSPRPNFTPYAVSKAGVVRLVDGRILTHVAFGIEVGHRLALATAQPRDAIVAPFSR